MSGQVISIDFGTKNIHIVAGSNKAGTVIVSKTLLVDAPAGVYSDGKIEDRKMLKDLLHMALKKNDIGAKDVIFSVQSSAVVTRDATMPVMKQQELDSAVRFEMEQYLPSIINGYYIEYKVLQEVAEEAVKKYRVHIAAIPADFVDAYYQLARDLRLNPIALDIHSNAISKLFASEEKTVAVVDFGYNSTTINIISKGVLEFSRNIATGARELDTAIASSLDIPLDDAEFKKTRKIKIDQLANNPETPESMDNRMYIILNMLMSEIQKVFQYYTNRNRDNRINDVYIHGGGSNLKGLPEFMKSQLNLEAVSQIKSLKNVSFAKNTNTAGMERFLNAVGAMIRL